MAIDEKYDMTRKNYEPGVLWIDIFRQNLES